MDGNYKPNDSRGSEADMIHGQNSVLADYRQSEKDSSCAWERRRKRSEASWKLRMSEMPGMV